MTVQTETQVSQDIRVITRQGLLPARGGGWWAGYGNMFSKELGEWFRTRRWLWQLLIWSVILDGLIAFMLFALPVLNTLMPGLPTQEQLFAGLPPEVGTVIQFFSFLVMTGTIGTIILTQDEIIQEKQSGTAAWILSKPVARLAFIMTKLLSNITGVLVFIVLVPGVILIGQVSLATHQPLPLVPFLAGSGVILLALIFYVCLVILLGVLFESRGPVLGIAFGVLWGGMILRNFIPQILYVLPLGMEGVAMGVLQGIPLPAMYVSELISTAVLSILFTLVALWRFQHIEL